MSYISANSAATAGSGVTVDTFTAGVDYTAGSSSQVTLSNAPASVNAVWVFFNGVAQHHSQYSVNGNVVSFTSAIPINVSEVQVQVNTQLAVGVPGEATVSYDKLTSAAKTTLQRKNAIINGNFDIWQRGTSQSATGYGSDDRWSNDVTGSTQSHTRQSFALGQTAVPNNPRYFSRTTVTSSAGASNYALKKQKIESVHTFAGETITLSFWAKADASKNIAVEFYQFFGTTGSPSAVVDAIDVTTVSLTTSWVKYTITVSIPSISGKTLGTDDNDYLAVYFWFDAGSDFNSRTNSLGQQSGTFDIAQVQVEEGSSATNYERRSVGEEFILCQRYFQQLSPSSTANEDFGTGLAQNTTAGYCAVIFDNTMRAIPTVTFSAASTLKVYDGASHTLTGISAVQIGHRSLQANITTTGMTAFRPLIFQAENPNTASIELDAEL